MLIDASELLTIAPAAKRSPLSEPALRARIKDARLDVIRIGGHILLTESELRQKLGEQYHSAT